MSESNATNADVDVGQEYAPEDERNALGHLIGTYGRPHALRFGVGGVAMALSQVPGRVPALLVGIALDALLLETTPYSLPLVPEAWIPGTVQGQVLLTAAIFAVAFGLEGGLSWIGGRISGTATYRTLHDVRVDTFDSLLGQEMDYFDSRQTGDLMSVLNNDVGNLRRFGDAAFRGMRFLTQVAVSFAFMALLHWQLAIVLALMPILLAGLSYWYAVRVEPRYDAVRSTIGTVNSRLEDSIEGIATVKAFGREDHERDRIEDVSAQYRDDKWSVIRLRLVYNLSTWLTGSLVFVAVFGVGALIVMGAVPAFVEPITAGTLVTFLFYGKSFHAPIRQLILEVLDAYENALASSKRIVAVLERPNALAEDGSVDETDPDAVNRESDVEHLDRHFTDGRELRVDEPRLTYDDVTFAYDEGAEPTVEDVSFTAEPGDLVGVVGPTGAGKSTIVKLLFRFYDPDSGTISIDDTDVGEVSRRSLRQHLGYVSQDPFLFAGTIRENIAYATSEGDRSEGERSEPSMASGSDRRERHASRRRPPDSASEATGPASSDVDDEAVIDAAKRAGAHEFVADLPDGYDTDVGDRGSKLSGGQRQRIAIARALLRDPAILVLDEATSHVDNETERQIQASVDALGDSQTTISIAHRLSTVRNADRILVMDGGKIREAGTHEELLAREGLYADLWRVQVGDTEGVSEDFFDRATAGEVGR